MNPGHQPSRFEVYKELPDGTGFTLEDSPHVFLFDRYGGWTDEYGNYYNERGQPDDLPSSSDSHSHSHSRSSFSSRSSSDPSDPYEAEFGVPGEYSEQQEEQREEEGAAIAKNLYNLHAYPVGQPLRVYIRNLPFKTRRSDLLKAYSAHAEGILNAIVDTDQQGRGIGTGYFIVRTEGAQQVVKLEGRRILDRPLYFQIEDYENFLVFPVEERELGEQVQAPKKKYVEKNPPVQKEEVVIPEVKWAWYKFEKDCFPKKADFKNWMTEHGFNAEEDYRNIEKVESEKAMAKVEMKESVFDAMNGLLLGERTVNFTPI